MAKWYVSIDSKASGPFDTNEVIESIRQRKYVLVDLVYQEGGSLWQSFDEVPEFKIIFDELKAQDDSRSKANSYLNHPWVLLKKTKEDGPDKYLQEGPFSADEVLAQISSGQAQYSDYAWKKGFDKWVRIGFIPEFDRMKDFDENSFFNYKMPLPEVGSEIPDPDANKDQNFNEDVMSSVRILKKDETFYNTPEDDPDFNLGPDPFHEQDPFHEVEVTSVAPMDVAKPPPQFNKNAAKTFHEDGIQPSEGTILRPPKNEKVVKSEPTPPPIEDPPVEKRQAVEASEGELEDTDLIPKKNEKKSEPASEPKKSSLFSAFSKKPKEENVSAKAPENKPENKLENKLELKPEAKPEAKKDLPKEQKKEKPKEKQAAKPKENIAVKESPPEKKFQEPLMDDSKTPTDEPTVLVKKKRQSKNYSSIFMTFFSIFALVAIVLAGMYSYRILLFGENSNFERWVVKIQRALTNEEPAEIKTTRIMTPPPPRMPTPTQAQETAALDPNMKPKVENQLESGANQKLPDANVPPPPTPAPMNEPPRTANQKATYVDIDFKNFAKNSKAQLLTNGSNGTVILVYVSARTGEILTYPSFYREYKVVRKANKNLELDLSSIPPGRYNVEAEIGDLKKLRVLSVKEDDFNKKIEAHMKQVSFEQQKEKKALFYGTKSLEVLLKKLFEGAKASQAPSKEWSAFYSNFKQSTKTSLSSLMTSLNDSNRNNYAYPDEIFDLLDIKDSLLKNAEEIDRDLKAKKAIETKPEQDILRELEKIRKRAGVLSVRKI